MFTVVPEPAAGVDRAGSIQLGESSSLIDDLVRQGARRMLAEALQAEVEERIARFADERDERGHRLVVRNGYHEPREVLTSAGAVAVHAPRINDRRVDPDTGERARFTSAILPPWCRKTPKINEVLPLLYLHGLSTSDFRPALGQFLGSSAGLSASMITKLTETWQAEQRAFAARDLSAVDYVYLWVDGIHVNIRLQEHKLCLLVMIGVRADGRKELVALADGYRESVESWADLLRDCSRRGMRAPVLAIGDGALGFWGALREVFPATREQRCWFHSSRKKSKCSFRVGCSLIWYGRFERGAGSAGGEIRGAVAAFERAPAAAGVGDRGPVAGSWWGPGGRGGGQGQRDDRAQGRVRTRTRRGSVAARASAPRGRGPQKRRSTGPGAGAALLALVEPDERGDPMSPLRWTNVAAAPGRGADPARPSRLGADGGQAAGGARLQPAGQR
jgi:hypothetical protein